jgi:hypothetical protein
MRMVDWYGLYLENCRMGGEIVKKIEHRVMPIGGRRVWIPKNRTAGMFGWFCIVLFEEA